MAVAFDNNFLLIALRKEKIAASVDRAKERVLHLIETLDQNSEKIIIPTPALAEFLVHSGRAAGTYLEELQKSAGFRIAAFDTRAAIEVSLDIAASIKKKDKKGGATGTWAKANFDRQIAAIAKVEGAHTIYTDDEGVEKPALRMGLKVIKLADLPIPPSKTPLFDYVQEQEAQAAAVDTKNVADEHKTAEPERESSKMFVAKRVISLED